MGVGCFRGESLGPRLDQSARSAEIFFAFIFHFSGWAAALVAPSRFALQVPDVRGLQVPLAQGRDELLPCSNFAHERNTYVHGGVY